MKLVLAAIFISIMASIFPTFVLAQTDTDNMEGPPPMPSSFEERKPIILNDIDSRIKNLQELKKCVSAAKDDTELGYCIRKYRPKPPAQKTVPPPNEQPSGY